MNIELLWWLIVGHAVADFGLQSDSMGRGKNWKRKPDPATIPPGVEIQTIWPYWLTSHALIHGATTALATGVWWLGACEAAAHWMIDLGKCSNFYGIHTDQTMHVMCKVTWWAIAVSAL